MRFKNNHLAHALCFMAQKVSATLPIAFWDFVPICFCEEPSELIPAVNAPLPSLYSCCKVGHGG